MQKCRATEAGQTFENDLNFVRHSDSGRDDSWAMVETKVETMVETIVDTKVEMIVVNTVDTIVESAVVKVRIVVRIKGMIVEPIVLRQYSSKVFSRQSKK